MIFFLRNEKQFSAKGRKTNTQINKSTFWVGILRGLPASNSSEHSVNPRKNILGIHLL